MTNADRIQHALAEARGIDTPAAMNKIRKEIATDLQQRHGDWSVGDGPKPPGLQDHRRAGRPRQPLPGIGLTFGPTALHSANLAPQNLRFYPQTRPFEARPCQANPTCLKPK